MDVNIWQYLTFWNVILVIFCLPLVTMLITMPFVSLLSKNIKEWLNLFGILGFVANCIVVVRLAFWTFGTFIAYYKQKPQIVFDSKLSRFTNYHEPFDSSLLIYVVMFLILTIATGVMVAKKKNGRLGKSYSEKNPLNLNG